MTLAFNTVLLLALLFFIAGVQVMRGELWWAAALVAAAVTIVVLEIALNKRKERHEAVRPAENITQRSPAADDFRQR